MNILVVEDDALVALQIESVLGDAGFKVIGVADTLAGALTLAETGQPELALVDINLADGDNGLILAETLQQHGIRVLLTSGNCPPDSYRRCAAGCLCKPYAGHELVAAVNIIRQHAAGQPHPTAPTSLHLF